VSDNWDRISHFDIPSIPGTERQVVDRVVGDLEGFLAANSIDRLKTAVSEAVMNAIEHGNKGQVDKMVHIELLSNNQMVKIAITDHGSEMIQYVEPNIESKVAGLESPRGWGMFLIRNMVDDLRITSDENHHVVEMYFLRESKTHE
jgi:anti-sigma regulatory factor (Ser/Thr protein kinase)